MYTYEQQLGIANGYRVEYELAECKARLNRLEVHLGMKTSDQISDEQLQPSGEIVLTPDVFDPDENQFVTDEERKANV